MSVRLDLIFGFGLTVAGIALMLWRMKVGREWRVVGVVSKIYIYPLKSGRYKEIPEAECTPLGLKFKPDNGKAPLRDRVFVVYDQETMLFVCAKTHVDLLKVNVEPKDKKTMVFSYPGKESIEVNLTSAFEDKTIEMWQKEKIRISDCGDIIAKWISEICGKDSYRVAYWPEEEHWRRNISYRKKEFEVFKNTNNEYIGAYSDLSSYNILNNNSVIDLNNRLEEENKTTALNFRPNFVIDGPAAYEEDKWTWIRIGDAVFQRFRPCTRCTAVTFDSETAEKNPKFEPLSTLRKYRTMKMLGEPRIDPHSPVLGLYAGLHEAGKVKVGDFVFASN